ncbi:uncharacterized protein LOC115333771 isoform X2 [Aquila chrysaetos chrysaetos]|uniref:uncharacterized protein LOC115333771 isoform X2 n=1 Tax=Aquila chrysaetos chrysaetos TaxID=223781 RepID=UPI001B7D3CAF|nr:uncharacterized protein LOC115333771 isoform X2 [Aquila chrysaetos chrysaetos]
MHSEEARGKGQGKATPAMSSSALLAEGPLDPPVLLADIKTEPPEELLASDCGQPQAEPVDLSLNKSKVAAVSAPPPPPPASVQSSPLLVAPPLPAPATVSISPSGLSSTSAIPAVLSPGSILASTQGSGGQQILHVIHTIPSVNLPSKMGNLQTIPVVVQSLPVVYTTMPTDGVTAITVPLIGGDGKNAGSAFLSRPPPVKIDPGSMYPMDMNSDSEDSASESGPAPFQDLQREREALQMHLGRLHLEVRPFRRADPALPQAHGHQALPLLGLRPQLLPLRPPGPSPPAAHYDVRSRSPWGTWLGWGGQQWKTGAHPPPCSSACGGGTVGAERPSSARHRANRGRSRSPTGTRCKKDGFRTGSPLLLPFLLFPGLLLPTCNVRRLLLDSSPVIHPAAASRPARLPHRPLARLHLMCSLSPAPLQVPVGKIWEPWKGQRRGGGSAIAPVQ